VTSLSHRPTLRSHPFGPLLGGVLLLYLAGVALAPETVRDLECSPEGPIEHASHVVLVAVLALFVAAATAARGRAATVCAVVWCLYLALLLLEEIDFGRLYGIDLGYSLLERAVGAPNLHNAPGHASSLVGWAQVWIAAPMAGYFLAPLVAWPAWRQRLERIAPFTPVPADAILFLALAVLAVALDSVKPLDLRLGAGSAAATACPHSPLPLFQLLTYVLIGMVGGRALRALRSLRSTAEPR
jgi:hypothetical protein